LELSGSIDRFESTLGITA